MAIDERLDYMSEDEMSSTSVEVLEIFDEANRVPDPKYNPCSRYESAEWVVLPRIDLAAGYDGNPIRVVGSSIISHMEEEEER